jgi:small subunit ribosomal protein S20
VARHKSAEKRARQAVRRAARNTAIERQVKTTVRACRETLSQSDKSKTQAAVATAARELQKAASKGVLHKRNASRRVSRLMKAANTQPQA